MKTLEWMKLLSLTLRDLADAVDVYVKATNEMKNGKHYWQVYLPTHCIKTAIKRRITQMRQDLLALEREIDE